MSRRHYVNNAPALTLASSITSGATSCTISGTFSGWPVQFPFYATLDIGLLSEEIVLVTNIVGTTATISRGQDGTAAVSHTAGATLNFTVGAADFDEANAHVNATTGVHGISGSVVGTSDAQTLSNKTEASPILTGTMTGAGAINITGGVTSAGALTGATAAVAGAASVGSVTASGNGAVTGVVIPKTYTNEAAATAALVTPVTGSVVWLTAPTTGPVGLYSYNGTSWLAVCYNPPAFKGTVSAGPSIPTAAFTAIGFDQETVDTHNGHSTSTNNSRYTAVAPGLYSVFGSVGWTPNATGRRIASIFVNGAEIADTRSECSPTATASTAQTNQPETLVQLAVGDFVEIRAFQSSGGALSATTAGTNLNIFWLRP